MSQVKMTYADYCKLQDDRRYEVIDGVIYLMSAPSVAHQRVLGALHLLIGNYLRGKLCSAFLSPFDVRLPYGNETGETATTVVQPDLLVICDKSKLQGTGCVGAPDLVVEILSPSTATHDLITKRDLYEQAGVTEYWVVDPLNKTISILKLDGDKFGVAKSYKEEETVFSGVLSELSFSLREVFEEEDS